MSKLTRKAIQLNEPLRYGYNVAKRRAEAEWERGRAAKKNPFIQKFVNNSTSQLIIFYLLLFGRTRAWVNTCKMCAISRFSFDTQPKQTERKNLSLSSTCAHQKSTIYYYYYYCSSFALDGCIAAACTKFVRIAFNWRSSRVHTRYGKNRAGKFSDTLIWRWASSISTDAMHIQHIGPLRWLRLKVNPPKCRSAPCEIHWYHWLLATGYCHCSIRFHTILRLPISLKSHKCV